MKNLILILLIIPTQLFSQGWDRTFGGELNDKGYSVQQTTDEGYILTGDTWSFGNGKRDVYLIKTDISGDTLWTKTYGGESYDMGYAVKQTSDGGYIISGTTSSFGIGSVDVYSIKTDNNGDTLWTKRYGGEDSDYAESVQQTNDEGFIFAGYSQSFGNGYNDVYLIKTNSTGDTLWTKTYGGEYNDWGHSVQQTIDGGYIIIGSTSSFGTGNNDVYLIKTDSNGDTLWTKTYGGEEYDSGYFGQQTDDRGYIITGITCSIDINHGDIYMIKTDSSGNILWTKIYGGDYSDVGNYVQQTADGGYILIGETDSFGNSSNVYLLKTDNNGDTIWTKTYSGENYSFGNSAQQTTEGGYIITGGTYSFASLYDVLLIKTDENGIITFTSEITVPYADRKLIKTVDIRGSEISKPEKNQPYIEIYDDGSTQKKMKLK